MFLNSFPESSNATGPDQIPVVVLKQIHPELSPILAKLFNRCLKDKCFPNIWKHSVVCPVFINYGERSQPSQYSPIRLLSVISKLFESILNANIMTHLNNANLLSDMQYGFRPSRSTADVLTVIIDRIIRVLDTVFDARMIALDISKAFHKVWHKGLLHKLKGYGLGGRVLSITKKYESRHHWSVF